MSPLRVRFHYRQDAPRNEPLVWCFAMICSIVRRALLWRPVSTLLCKSSISHDAEVVWVSSVPHQRGMDTRTVAKTEWFVASCLFSSKQPSHVSSSLESTWVFSQPFSYSSENPVGCDVSSCRKSEDGRVECSQRTYAWLSLPRLLPMMTQTYSQILQLVLPYLPQWKASSCTLTHCTPHQE